MTENPGNKFAPVKGDVIVVWNPNVWPKGDLELELDSDTWLSFWTVVRDGASWSATQPEPGVWIEIRGEEKFISQSNWWWALV